MLNCLLLASCVPLGWNPPTESEKEGTIWVADNPPMYIVIDFTENFATIGKSKDNLNIKVSFGYGSASVYDIDKFIYPDTGGLNVNAKESLLFCGENRCKDTEFTIIATESNIDSVAVGDKVVFYRVDELPEWAAKMEDPENTQENKPDSHSEQ
jgi:hypothetical protein